MPCQVTPPLQPDLNTNTNIQAVTVNGKIIDTGIIAAELQYHPAESVEQAVYKATTALIIQELLLQKAHALQKDNSLETSDDIVCESGESRDEAIIRHLLATQVQAPLADEDSCQRYFSANENKFCSSALLEASHILIAADPQEPEQRSEANVLAESLLEQLKKNTHLFAEYAKEYSCCSSKKVGGSLGQISKGQTTPEFERQVFTLSDGLANYPIETRYGFHLVKIDRKIDGRPLPYDVVKEKIARYLNEKSERKAISHFIQVLLGEADIEGFEIEQSRSPLLQ